MIKPNGRSSRHILPLQGLERPGPHNLAHLIILLFLCEVPVLATSGSNHTTAERIPSKITLKAAVIPNAFGDFQRDLLARLQLFALEDNFTLEFETTEVQEVYCQNLRLIAPSCQPGETVEINNVTYSCDFDMIVGDFWPSPGRYSVVDFTPPWLHTSISTIKYVDKSKYPLLDVTTLTEASVMGTHVCAMEHSPLTEAVTKAFPQVIIVPCNPSKEAGKDGCINMLKNEECSLWVSDELELMKHQAGDPSLEMTGERLNRQLLAWPVRRSLDSTVSFLLNKWMYAAISNQTIDELYFEYFEKKLCPIGTTGKHCDLPCDPNHGRSDSRGKCFCESMRWTGDDCSIEVLEEHHMIPSALKLVAYAMLAFNVLVITVCGAWLCIHWESSQVRVSQPFFLLLVLLGCLISSSTILALAQDDEEDGPVRACMAIPWLYSVGFSVTFGTLFAKIRRVYTLFKQDYAVQPLSRSWYCRWNPGSFQDTSLSIGAVLLLDVIILVLWTALDPLEWQHIIIREDQFGDPLESHGHCSSHSWKIFGVIIGALHLSLLALACCICYLARDIPTKYQEGKYVSIAMISNLQIFVVGVPTLIVVSGDPAICFFVRSTIIWMNDLAVVTLIFGNLMHSVHASSSKSGGNTKENKSVLHCTPNPRIEGSGNPIGLQRSPSSETSDDVSLPCFPLQPYKHKRDFVMSSLTEKSAPSRPGFPVPPPLCRNRRDLVLSSLTEISASKKRVSFSEHVLISEYEEVSYHSDREEEAKSDRFSSDPPIQGTSFNSRKRSLQERAMKQPIRQPSIIKIEVPPEPPPSCVCPTGPIKSKSMEPGRPHTWQYDGTCQTTCSNDMKPSHRPPQKPHRPRSPVQVQDASGPRRTEGPMRLPRRLQSMDSVQSDLACEEQPASPWSVPPNPQSEAKTARVYQRKPGEA